MVDIEIILSILREIRPIFHLEADFQHAMAWEIHKEWPECSMRLEFKPPTIEGRNYIDIWVKDADGDIAIELKYKTLALTTVENGETFNLVDQGGQPLYRYDFLKDIQRLEHLVNEQRDLRAYGLFLTNDSGYWTSPRGSGQIDEAFRIHDGQLVEGDLRWGANAAAGTTKGREEPILLRNTYIMRWRDYSEPVTSAHGRFRYLLAKVSA